MRPRFLVRFCRTEKKLPWFDGGTLKKVGKTPITLNPRILKWMSFR